jgi:hypothetical protein
MLDDNLQRPKRHVTTGHTVSSSRAPLVRRDGLEEVLDCWEKLYRVELQICQVLGNIPG